MSSAHIKQTNRNEILYCSFISFFFCSPPVYPEYRTLDHSESVRVASKPHLVLNGDRLFWALQRQRGKSDSYVQITGVLSLLFKCKY